MKSFGLIKKPHFSKTALAIFVAIFVLVGIYIVYRIFAAGNADLMDGSVVVTTVKGVDRTIPIDNVAKAIDVSKKMYPAGAAPAVVITSPSDNSGAMQASLIAGAEKAPLLYSGNTLPATVVTEIQRLRPMKIYVVASSTVLSSTFDITVRNSYPTAVFERIGGANRDVLARNVGVKLVALNGRTLSDGTIILVNPGSYTVETVGFLGGIKKYPVLFASSVIPTETALFISAFRPTKTIIFATTGAIPDATVAAMAGKIRITGSGRPEQSIALLKYAKTLGAIDYSEIAVVSDTNFSAAMLAGPYMAKLKKGVLLDGFKSDAAATTFLKSIATSYGLTKVHLVADDISLSNENMMKYANAIGSNYTTAQLNLQAMMDLRIKKCPQLTGSTADYGDTRGYQAITYYTTGRTVINPNHTATLDRLLNHEIYHTLDWRDNNVINWSESVPHFPPYCTI